MLGIETRNQGRIKESLFISVENSSYGADRDEPSAHLVASMLGVRLRPFVSGCISRCCLPGGHYLMKRAADCCPSSSPSHGVVGGTSSEPGGSKRRRTAPVAAASLPPDSAAPIMSRGPAQQAGTGSTPMSPPGSDGRGSTGSSPTRGIGGVSNSRRASTSGRQEGAPAAVAPVSPARAAASPAASQDKDKDGLWLIVGLGNPGVDKCGLGDKDGLWLIVGLGNPGEDK